MSIARAQPSRGFYISAISDMSDSDAGQPPPQRRPSFLPPPLSIGTRRWPTQPLDPPPPSAGPLSSYLNPPTDLHPNHPQHPSEQVSLFPQDMVVAQKAHYFHKVYQCLTMVDS